MSPHNAVADRKIELDLPLPPSTLIGLVVAVVAVAVIALLTYRTLQTRESSAFRVTETLEIQQRLEALLSSVKDAETGERGYLLTGEARYVDSFTAARADFDSELASLRSSSSESVDFYSRLEEVARLASERMIELEQTIERRRAGNTAAATEAIRTDRGEALMDRLRATVDLMEQDERTILARSQAEFERAVTRSTWLTLGGAGLLVVLIALGAFVMSRDFHSREMQAWIRVGQTQLAARMQGEQRLETLGDNVLEGLARYLGAYIGTIYVTQGDGSFGRIAGYALPRGAAPERITAGDGLIGQVVKERRPIRVQDLPDGFLIGSTVGRGVPSELLIAPGVVDGVVHAVVELGFLRRVEPREEELLARMSESIGVAVRASRDRTRLEELLEETQRQAEELQTQQEELRVSNEELEEQGRVLRESQARLETQQAELEQINTQLEEQTELLEVQKDELVRSQRVLAEKAEELERANRYKSEFLANMSHELRTPLNSSLILARLLADNRDGNLTPEQVKYAQTIGSAGTELLALINDILDLSKIEAGRIDFAIEPVRVSKAIDAVVKGLQPLAGQKRLTLESRIDAGVPDVINTDAQRLGQILKNLVSNAVKFTEQGSVTIHVTAPAADAIAIAVRDTGIGIPADQQSVIFEAFRQADGSTHRRYGGTGLGLSISRDLARRLGGDITVASTPGEGSVFTLTVPVAFASSPDSVQTPRSDVTAPSPLPPAPRDKPAPVPSSAIARAAVADDRDRLTADSRRLLIIEDDARFADVLADLARERGFQCIIVHAANDGVMAANTYHPNAVLLDINLPDFSGLGVLDQLKRNPLTRHVPVHVISVEDYSHQALERGAVGYAMKPVQRDQLLTAFQKLEARLTPGPRRVLVVEDDERQRESIAQLLGSDTVEIVGVGTVAAALAELRATTFDCVVTDLKLPDRGGDELLREMAEHDDVSFPPVIVYTGRSLTRDEEQQLGRFSRSIIIKDARSPERLLDEVTLFLHQVESSLPPDRQRMLKLARDRDAALEGRRILVVEDDARNIFALSRVLEPKGARVEVARNGREALEVLDKTIAAGPRIDLVLMDIMMPEMDGLTAMREVRQRPALKKLPIIALTAKAMKDDQEKCLAAGANDYIAKPLDVEKLLSLIRVWMPKERG